MFSFVKRVIVKKIKSCTIFGSLLSVSWKFHIQNNIAKGQLHILSNVACSTKYVIFHVVIVR